MFQNGVLRTIFGSERVEVNRTVDNEELSDLLSSPNTTRIIKSRRMCWARHVARTGDSRGV